MAPNHMSTAKMSRAPFTVLLVFVVLYLFFETFLCFVLFSGEAVLLKIKLLGFGVEIGC